MQYEKDKRMNQITSEIQNNSSKVFTSHHTENIFQTMKTNTYKKLFVIAKEIYPFNKESSKIPSDVIKIINPLLQKVKLNFNSITEEKFVNECNLFFNVRNNYVLETQYKSEISNNKLCKAV